jgi:hypothetical protein
LVKKEPVTRRRSLPPPGTANDDNFSSKTARHSAVACVLGVLIMAGLRNERKGGCLGYEPTGPAEGCCFPYLPCTPAAPRPKSKACPCQHETKRGVVYCVNPMCMPYGWHRSCARCSFSGGFFGTMALFLTRLLV